jgi:hypothetical protein
VRPCPGGQFKTFSGANPIPRPTQGVVYFSMINMDQFSMLIDSWAWVPGNEWAPSWVSFQEGPDYVGWAPCRRRRAW